MDVILGARFHGDSKNTRMKRVCENSHTSVQDRAAPLHCCCAADWAPPRYVTATASLGSGKKLASHGHVQFERDLHSGSWLHLVLEHVTRF